MYYAIKFSNFIYNGIMIKVFLKHGSAYYIKVAYITPYLVIYTQ